MEIQRDYKELLELFNAHNVEYIIVGGYALAFHGAPRFTGDMDLFVKPDAENAQRILAALAEFGMGSLDLSQNDFTSLDNVIQIGVDGIDGYIVLDGPDHDPLDITFPGYLFQSAENDRVVSNYEITSFFNSLGNNRFG